MKPRRNLQTAITSEPFKPQPGDFTATKQIDSSDFNGHPTFEFRCNDMQMSVSSNFQNFSNPFYL